MSKPTYLKPAHLLATVSVTLAAGTASAAGYGQLPEARQAQLRNFTQVTHPTQARALIQTKVARERGRLIETSHYSHYSSHGSHASHGSHVSHQSSAY